MSMSFPAKAAWPLLWTECDDHGVFEWKPIVLKARIFPADNVDFSAILVELESLGCVTKFEIDGQLYGQLLDLKFMRRRVRRWDRLRAFIFERDGYRCKYCGSEAEPLHCDHVVPVIDGGDDDPSNLATACKPCNLSKGDKSVFEWLTWRERSGRVIH